MKRAVARGVSTLGPSMLGASLVVLGATTLTTPVRADESVWGMARQPARYARQRLKAHVDENLALYRPQSRKVLGEASALPLIDARRRLEKANASTSSDPEVRFRLAKVLYELGSTRHDRRLLSRAARLLESVARSKAPRSVRSLAFNQLAIAHAKLGHHGREALAYDGALALEPIAEQRSVLLSNQAESLMARGRIAEAISGYRASLATTPTRIAHLRNVTTHWGLAVALDRDGDLSRAFGHVARARSFDPVDAGLKDDGWFFVPAYDRYWYEALGHWQHARTAARASKARREALRGAIRAWRAYLSFAPQSDRYSALAGRRLTQCEEELARATTEKPAAKPAKK